MNKSEKEMNKMRDKVRKGYEEGQYAKEYREGRTIRDFEKELFEDLFEKIGEEGSILDLGCGIGIPFDRYFVDNGFEVTGVDFVEKNIKRAKENVPEANFLNTDFSQLDFTKKTFDAVVSFYAIFHIPREEHLDLLEKINLMLKESGNILITMGTGDNEKIESDFVDSKMLWSSFSIQKDKDLVKKAGFKILRSYEETEEEHHLWILAEKKD
ncbi:MAG: class I SAM-dependent methyltransferase [Candidatus Thermoplasmatota archaeon]|nr:class I SAM-dependent methyltransferase [Candidatus Thermoplasmatota archaeon]